MTKIIFILDSEASETIAIVNMPCVPRVGEKIWINLDGNNFHTFIVKEIEYDFSVLYESDGTVRYESNGIHKNSEMVLEHVSIYLSPTEDSINLNHKVLHDKS